MTRDRPTDLARGRYNDKEHIRPRGRRYVQRGDEDVTGPGGNPWLSYPEKQRSGISLESDQGQKNARAVTDKPVRTWSG